MLISGNNGTWDAVLRLPALAESHGVVHSIDPAVYSVEHLDKIRRDSPAAFELQYQNQAHLAAGTAFFAPEVFDPASYVQFENLSSQARSLARTIIALDPATGHDPGEHDASAFVAVTVVPSVPPVILVRHVERGHWGQAETVERAVKLCARFAPYRFLCEAQGGFALLADDVQRALRKASPRTRFEAVRGTGTLTKAARAERARSLFDRNLVRFCEPSEANGLDRLLWEMASFNPLRTRHEPGADDCVDALGWALLALARPTTRVY